MSEHTHDPIRDLQNFGTGGLGVDPLEPAVVRRLGDKRRAQRRASLLVAASAFAVVAAVIPVTLTMTDDDTAPLPPATTSTPTPTPSPTGPTLGLGNIPEDFPLAKGAPDYSGDGGERLGPDPEVQTAAPAVCQVDPLGGATALGRLGFRSTGPEVADDRELRTFRTAAAAEAVMQAIRDELDGCSNYTGESVQHKVTSIDVDTGWESITFSDTDLPSAEGLALGGAVFQVTRVGTAILTVAHSGEVNENSAAAVARTTLTEGTRAVAPEMCEFTPDSCGSGPSGSEAPRTITYPGTYDSDGVVIRTDDDLDLLRGAPDSFKEFIRGLIAVEIPAGSCGEPLASRQAVDVQRISTAGYAMGNVRNCPGTWAVWAVRDGSWTEVMGGTDALTCQDLDREQIPRTFAGTCYNVETDRSERSGDFGPLSVDGISLGMTADEVRALGGTVPAGSGCRFVSLPGTAPSPNQGDGWLSDQGVVAIVAGETSQRMTPEGISPGSRRTEVEAAYPQGVWQQQGEGGGYYVVPLAGNARYRFAMGDTATSIVVSIELSLSSQNCFE